MVLIVAGHERDEAQLATVARPRLLTVVGRVTRVVKVAATRGEEVGMVDGGRTGGIRLITVASFLGLRFTVRVTGYIPDPHKPISIIPRIVPLHKNLFKIVLIFTHYTPVLVILFHNKSSNYQTTLHFENLLQNKSRNYLFSPQNLNYDVFSPSFSFCFKLNPKFLK